jgi:hypothetical protein
VSGLEGITGRCAGLNTGGVARWESACLAREKPWIPIVSTLKKKIANLLFPESHLVPAKVLTLSLCPEGFELDRCGVDWRNLLFCRERVGGVSNEN